MTAIDILISKAIQSYLSDELGLPAKVSATLKQIGMGRQHNGKWEWLETPRLQLSVFACSPEKPGLDGLFEKDGWEVRKEWSASDFYELPVPYIIAQTIAREVSEVLRRG